MMELLECKNELHQAEKLLSHYRDKYYRLKESEWYPLTENTGKQLIAIVESTKSEGKKSYRRRNTVADPENNSDNESPDEEVEVGSIKDDLIHLVDNIWIRKTAYEDAFRIKLEPSKFITTLAYAVWSTAELAKKSVRQQKYCADREALSPKKRNVVIQHYSKWLAREKYQGEIFDKEIKKVNTYFGRATSASIRRLARGTEENKTENNSETSKMSEGDTDANSNEESKQQQEELSEQ